MQMMTNNSQIFSNPQNQINFELHILNQGISRPINGTFSLKTYRKLQKILKEYIFLPDIISGPKQMGGKGDSLDID